MNIGIIGYGKMGSEIFSLFFSSKYKNHITVICRNGHDKIKESIIKNLSRQLRRKLINEAEFETMQQSFEITADMSHLSECELIIETISEDLNAKQNILFEAEKYAPENCVITTNTSSIPVNDIFTNIKIKKRCCGFHFFYPIKLSEFIEINKADFTDIKTVKFLENLSISLGMESIVFNGINTFYFNQISALYIFHSVYVSRKLNVSFADIETSAVSYNSLYGVCTLADTIGSELIIKSSDNFKIKRIHEIIDFNISAYKESIEKISSSKLSDSQPDDELYIHIIAPVLNEIIIDAENSDRDYAEKIIHFSASALGITNSFSDIYIKYGYEKIKSVLLEYFNENNFEVLNPAEKNLYDKYYL